MGRPEEPAPGFFDRLGRKSARSEAVREGLLPPVATVGGQPTNQRLRGAISRRRDRRRRRRIEHLEGKIAARTTLRDYKRSTGD